MGLAEPRKRMKLSHDPNNTKWTRDTGGFGHKIMTSQGWQPGEYLGAKDAAHAEFHTAANASHIRVSVKDDNLGLGAKKGSGLAEGECTGLDAFQALLGRLNGKDDDELQKEQKSREDLKRAIYSERKWGSVRFVKGGFLIGDKIQKLIDDEAERLRSMPKNKSPADTDTVEEDLSEVKKSKKKRKEKIIREAIEDSDKAAEDAEISIQSEDDDSKFKSKHNLEEEDHAAQKAAKKQRKKERAERRAAKNEETDAAMKATSTKKNKKSKRASHDNDSESEPTTALVSSPSITPESPPATPQHFAGNRHAVRARFIAHKKLAHIDNAALDQIFMIKRS